MQLNETEKKTLAKINLASSESAADALRQMISKEVKVDFPSISLRTSDMIDKFNDSSIVGVSKISGDISGSILLHYQKEKGMALLEILMMQEKGSLSEMTEDAKGAFTEYLNIIGGVYLSKIADEFKFKVLPNPPQFIGNLESMEKELIRPLKQANDIFLIDTCLHVESEEIDGDFFILLDNESLNKILSALRQ